MICCPHYKPARLTWDLICSMWIDLEMNWIEPEHLHLIWIRGRLFLKANGEYSPIFLPNFFQQKSIPEPYIWQYWCIPLPKGDGFGSLGLSRPRPPIISIARRNVWKARAVKTFYANGTELSNSIANSVGSSWDTHAVISESHIIVSLMNDIVLCLHSWLFWIFTSEISLGRLFTIARIVINYYFCFR